jgi:hypothetical protein
LVLQAVAVFLLNGQAWWIWTSRRSRSCSPIENTGEWRLDLNPEGDAIANFEWFEVPGQMPAGFRLDVLVVDTNSPAYNTLDDTSFNAHFNYEVVNADGSTTFQNLRVELDLTAPVVSIVEVPNFVYQGYAYGFKLEQAGEFPAEELTVQVRINGELRFVTFPAGHGQVIVGANAPASGPIVIEVVGPGQDYYGGSDFDPYPGSNFAVIATYPHPNDLNV